MSKTIVALYKLFLFKKIVKPKVKVPSPGFVCKSSFKTLISKLLTPDLVNFPTHQPERVGHLPNSQV